MQARITEAYDKSMEWCRVSTTPGQPSLPILAVSARSMGDEEERVAAAGMRGFARKPVDAVMLQRLLAGLDQL